MSRQRSLQQRLMVVLVLLTTAMGAKLQSGCSILSRTEKFEELRIEVKRRVFAGNFHGARQGLLIEARAKASR